MSSVNHDNVNNMIRVAYPMREATQHITRAEYDLIKFLDGHKITCIKFLRAQYQLGLYEAKQVVDTIHACGSPQKSQPYPD